LTVPAARTVLITGCSTGIGRAAARLFAARGYRVIATARNIDSLSGLESEATAAGQNLRSVECDVSDEASRQKAVALARDTYGDIQILINNAGYGLVGPLETVDIDDARRLFEVNTFGAMRMIQLVIPGMRQGGWGRIINISSIAGKMVIPVAGWYSASKFALEAISDTLRLELESFGIQTVSILPGPVKSEFRNNAQRIQIAAGFPEIYADCVQRARAAPARRRFEISAEAVASAIVKAAEADRPRPRYALTLPARVGLRLRPWFTDRGWDRVLKLFYGLK
jgi:NAD(P)-dependent dehydrogenase (short-subunit alcohol dehydrogenase family)